MNNTAASINLLIWLQDFSTRARAFVNCKQSVCVCLELLCDLCFALVSLSDEPDNLPKLAQTCPGMPQMGRPIERICCMFVVVV